MLQEMHAKPQLSALLSKEKKRPKAAVTGLQQIQTTYQQKQSPLNYKTKQTTKLQPSFKTMCFWIKLT